MRRLNLLLLASVHLCRARQPSFSIHEDLLAHPRFEVVFSDGFISETDALALLESSRASDPTYSADPSSQSDLTGNVREPATSRAPLPTGSSDKNGETDDDGDTPISETYELINSAPWRYLCSVPVLAPPPVLNRTATELAKAEEARELSRASAKGWELMSGLDGHCLYFMSGWWSYSFCYGKGVVQFHAAPSGNKGGPPVRDGNSQQYVLGRADGSWNGQDTTAAAAAEDGGTKSIEPPNAQLQVKGDQRYLMQRLEDGTICDLTGRPRTIEIQYHCKPGAAADRIGWIKEVTTCTYLMVVNTPRLCADVAFQPPKETRAHPITCRQIISNDEEESAWRYHKRVEAGELFGVAGTQKAKVKEAAKNQFVGMTIGGVVVGGNKVMGGSVEDGKPGQKLAVPRHVADNPAVVEIIGGKDGIKVVPDLSDDELAKRNIDPKKFGEMRKKLERVAGDTVFRVEVIGLPGQGFEVVTEIDMEDQEGGEKKENGLPQGEKVNDGDGNGKGGDDDKAQEGSQEIFFKEEL
ncbi:Protein OS-9 [Madurella fahalii]|uniref:Endoplasmic reticulum lectin n=1 Tax=Madurella fahalii TaxID=1157608 RepID=A0ABQ0G4H4_9PEZI